MISFSHNIFNLDRLFNINKNEVTKLSECIMLVES